MSDLSDDFGEKKRNSKEEKALEYVRNANRNHQGKWLDWNAVKEYQKRVKELNLCDYQYVGKLRELGEELQKEYGLLEIEAYNILLGYHVSSYINKYHRIKNCIPLNSSMGNRT